MKNAKLKISVALIVIGGILTVLPKFKGGGLLALVLLPVYVLAGVCLAVVGLIDARRKGSGASTIAAAFGPFAIVVGVVFLSAPSRPLVEDWLFRILFEIRRGKYDGIIATSRPGTAAVRVDRFGRSQVEWFVETSPPFRVVFPEQVYFAGWRGIVYDSGGSLADVRRVNNPFNVPQQVPHIFGSGYLDECRLIVVAFYRCSFHIPE